MQEKERKIKIFICVFRRVKKYIIRERQREIYRLGGLRALFIEETLSGS